MTGIASEWPTDEDLMFPSAEMLEDERRYWNAMDRIAEYEAWQETQAARWEDFTTWPLEDLEEELQTVLTLTPDQMEVIGDLEAAIQTLRAA